MKSFCRLLSTRVATLPKLLRENRDFFYSAPVWLMARELAALGERTRAP